MSTLTVCVKAQQDVLTFTLLDFRFKTVSSSQLCRCTKLYFMACHRSFSLKSFSTLRGELDRSHREDVDVSQFLFLGVSNHREHVVTCFSISFNHLPLPKALTGSLTQRSSCFVSLQMMIFVCLYDQGNICDTT